MITLGIIFIVWGIISYFRIKKVCKQTGKEFTPFEGSFLDYLGFLAGLAMLVVNILILAVRYLP